MRQIRAYFCTKFFFNFFLEIKVELIDNEMPKIYALRVGKIDENKYPGLVLQAISIARLIQDPLLCYSQIWNLDRDILSLKLHPMQNEIINLSGSRYSKDATELLQMLEIEFINAVNFVGVDLNRCNKSAHTAKCLQFVCGLGPCTAEHILKVLTQQETRNIAEKSSKSKEDNIPVVFNRQFLLSKCHLDRNVLINCAGFIKFDLKLMKKQNVEDDLEKYVEFLDCTRVHPEAYEWARKMAIDALDYDNDIELNSLNTKKALLEIHKDPKPLDDLDLRVFSSELWRLDHGWRLLTLLDIKNELAEPYREMRSEFKSMSYKEKFYCFAKEWSSTFYVGKMARCKIIDVLQQNSSNKLDKINSIRVIIMASKK